MLVRELNRAQCKTYLVACEETRRAMLIDPVRERVDRYLALLAYQRCTLDLVVETHTHADHRSGVWELRDLTDARVVMHVRAPAPHVDVHVEHGQQLTCGCLTLGVLHTPGHTPDGISLVCDGTVFTGDTLLIHGTGRADFAGGDPGAQYDAITQRLFTLPDETIVRPAHDYRGHRRSTIGEEKRTNPRLAGRSRAEYVEIMNNLGLPLPERIQEALQANQAAIEDDSVRFPPLAKLAEVRQLAPAEVQARLAAPTPPLLLDVREPDEFDGELGHVAGSLLLPLRELSARAGEIEGRRRDDVIVVCRAGVRSATAAALLTALGFERVWNLRGGMLDWHAAGLPVER
jgi:glyoxylase-like metal-dependent hydrolase (beta-lactamase superfamily II)/rhodanese-related sulfurtransferase